MANILLVEDNPDHAKLIMFALRDEKSRGDLVSLRDEQVPPAGGDRICWVKDGEEALNFLYQQGEHQDKSKTFRPDLIILDLRLPKVDGNGVLKQVKDDLSLKSIPIVILSSSGNDEEIARAYLNGVNSYVTKPVDFHQFREKVKQIKSYWLSVCTFPTNQK